MQLVEQVGVKGRRRFIVLTLFPFRLTDLRYPASPLLPIHRARRFAYARLRELARPGELRRGVGPGIEWARGGDHIGFEVRL